MKPGWTFCLQAAIFQPHLSLVSAYITTISPYTAEDVCTCPCLASSLNFSKDAATTMEEAVNKADQLEKELTVDKDLTSASTRTKVSQPDSRPSAKSIGAVGVVFIALVFGTIVVLDISAIHKDKAPVKLKPRHKKSLRKHIKHSQPAHEATVTAGMRQFIHSVAAFAKSGIPFSSFHNGSGHDVFPDDLPLTSLSSVPIVVSSAPTSSRFDDEDWSGHTGSAGNSPRDFSGWSAGNSPGGSAGNSPRNSLETTLFIRALQPPYKSASVV
ncbi:uncharacterized protein LOC131936004 isoform X2 [Physella acuta]|uniref:uncharacterized protein LOC131936004 isoform X2 n=1 Tax=Physella acuta TaxID=109671 RepID=UPI0027DABE95|nr:uncharacterized protein LOC131936004 isoform X2 [Physella acuta]